MRRGIALLLCALASSLAGCGGAGSTRSASGGGDPKGAIVASRAFLQRYVLPDGRVTRIDQGGDTVSEGQAYAMLVAAAIGDQARFDTVWSWTQHNLEQPDGLFAYHWAAGHVVDAQPASDADLDTARALLVAACRFHRPELRGAAIRLGQTILAHETARAGSLQVLTAGPWADYGTHLAFDPSYVDPTTLDDLARASGDARFRTVAADSVRLVNELARPLPPDWASVDTANGSAMPVSGAGATSGTGLFSYDAPRTLIRLAVGPDPTGRAAAARAWSVFSKTAPQDIVTEHALVGAAIGTTHSPITLVAVAAAARAAGAESAVPGLLDEAARWNAQSPTYYGSAWLALGQLMLNTTRLSVCSTE